MSEITRWVFTVCCGAMLCGIVSILSPGKGSQRLLEMVLGLFMLCCFLLPAGLELDLSELAPQSASSAMDAADREITGFFLRDTARRAREEIEGRLTEELAGYGINEEDIQIYIEAEEPEEESGLGLRLEVILPDQLRERQKELQERLEEALGIAVRIRYRREGL